MNERYSIVPQMSEYDSLISDWVPYIMYFNRPSFNGTYVSTDEFGFRITTLKNLNSVSYNDFINAKDYVNKNIVLGGSSAFGVGSTNDKYTIASILNQISNQIKFPIHRNILIFLIIFSLIFRRF